MKLKKVGNSWYLLIPKNLLDSLAWSPDKDFLTYDKTGKKLTIYPQT